MRNFPSTFFIKMNLNMKKYIIICMGLLFGAPLVNGQTLADALRYSRQDIVGTARSMGVANSMSALGADFTALAANPAGIGTYRVSEFVLSPSIYNNAIEATLENGGVGPVRDSKGSLALGNASIVIHNRPRSGSLVSSNIAIGINRIGNFNQSFQYRGKTMGSVTDRFLELSYGVAPDDLNAFEEGLGYATGAIYDFDEDLIYTSDFENVPEARVDKEQVINATGTTTELTLGYGANIENKLMFGLSLNVPILNFTEDKLYQENDGDGIDQEVPLFNRLSYREYLTTSGFGFNFKFGAIYKPDKAVSVGVAVHTPTTFNLTDNYFADFTYSYTEDQFYEYSESSPDGTFDYNLKTPWRAIGSLGIVINKSGFLSGEVEWVDYSNAGFQFDVRGNGNFYDDFETEINQSIRNQVGSALNLKFGGELVLASKFRARAGLGLIQSVFVDDNSFNTSYHAGLGVREDRFYVDLGIQFFNLDEGFAPYLTADGVQPFVRKESNLTRLAITVGYLFR